MQKRPLCIYSGETRELASSDYIPANASEVSFTPTSDIVSNTAQGAIEEVSNLLQQVSGEVPHIYMGTGSPPSAAGLPAGSIYFKYVI